MKLIWVKIVLSLVALLSMGCFEEFVVAQPLSSVIAENDSSTVEISSVVRLTISSSSSMSMNQEDESTDQFVSSSVVYPVFHSSLEADPQSSSSAMSSSSNSLSNLILLSSIEDELVIIPLKEDGNGNSSITESSSSLVMDVINSLSDSVFILNESSLNIGGITIGNIESVVKDTVAVQEDENTLSQYNFVGSSGEVRAKLVCLWNGALLHENYLLSEMFYVNGLLHRRKTYIFNENQELLQFSLQVVSKGVYSYTYASGVTFYGTSPVRVYFAPSTSEYPCKDTEALSNASSKCELIPSIEAGVIEAFNFFNANAF